MASSQPETWARRWHDRRPFLGWIPLCGTHGSRFDKLERLGQNHENLEVCEPMTNPDASHVDEVDSAGWKSLVSQSGAASSGPLSIAGFSDGVRAEEIRNTSRRSADEKGA